MVDFLNTLQQGASSLMQNVTNAPSFLQQQAVNMMSRNTFSQPQPQPQQPIIRRKIENDIPPSMFLPQQSRNNFLSQLSQQPNMMRPPTPSSSTSSSTPTSYLSNKLSSLLPNSNHRDSLSVSEPQKSQIIQSQKSSLSIPEPIKSSPILSPPQQKTNIIDNANTWIKEKAQSFPTWENTFGGMADIADRSLVKMMKPGTTDKDIDLYYKQPGKLTFTEQLKTFTAGEKGYTKDVIDPTTGQTVKQTFTAPAGALRDVAVPFTKTLWDMPRDDPAAAALYYSTPLVGAYAPLAISKLSQAKFLEPLVKPAANVLLRNPEIIPALDTASKGIILTTAGSEVAKAQGYGIGPDGITRDTSLTTSDISSRYAKALTNLVPFANLGTSSVNAAKSIEFDAIKANQAREYADLIRKANPTFEQPMAKSFTLDEKIAQINAPIKPNDIMMDPLHPTVISEANKIANQPKEYFSLFRNQEKIGKSVGDQGSVSAGDAIRLAEFEKNAEITQPTHRYFDIHNHPPSVIGDEKFYYTTPSGADISSAIAMNRKNPQVNNFYIATNEGVSGFRINQPFKSSFAGKVMGDQYENMIKSHQSPPESISGQPITLGVLEQTEKFALKEGIDNPIIAAIIPDIRSQMKDITLDTLQARSKALADVESGTLRQIEILPTLPVNRPFYASPTATLADLEKDVGKIEPFTPIQQPSIHDDTLQAKINELNKPFAASNILGTGERKISSTMQPIQHGQSREMQVIFDENNDPFAVIYGGKSSVARDPSIDITMQAQQMGKDPLKFTSIHTHPHYDVELVNKWNRYPSTGDIEAAADVQFGREGVSSDYGINTYTFKPILEKYRRGEPITESPYGLALKYEEILNSPGGLSNIGVAAKMLKEGGAVTGRIPYPNRLFMTRKPKQHKPKIKREQNHNSIKKIHSTKSTLSILNNTIKNISTVHTKPITTKKQSFTQSHNNMYNTLTITTPKITDITSLVHISHKKKSKKSK